MTRAEDIYREAPKICEATNLYLFVPQFHPYGRRRLLRSARNQTVGKQFVQGGGSVQHGVSYSSSSDVHHRDKAKFIVDGGVVVIVCDARAKQENVLSHRTRGELR